MHNYRVLFSIPLAHNRIAFVSIVSSLLLYYLSLTFILLTLYILCLNDLDQLAIVVGVIIILFSLVVNGGWYRRRGWVYHIQDVKYEIKSRGCDIKGRRRCHHT